MATADTRPQRRRWARAEAKEHTAAQYSSAARADRRREAAELRVSIMREKERRRRRPPDAITRLLDPEFTDALWEYPHSHIGSEVPGNLHAKQREMLANKARHRWLFWGNQCGKT